ncbi:hypothetical protein SEA_GAIL_46 [Mycobacterium phage Gail]|uniref:Uncharacterized protein n=1 Tax=Mycobacterium phage Gail TaxID=2743994 RepID=A0A7D5G260_9CAUD|nr:hypothetical protein KNV16_gp063 [Mycobacterium phage Gail]QLF84610.1 hypothetical protein SEA_GAIL_46 [Mycobacterium phage Gail]UJD21142.1 hypothetical protein SEA_SORORFAGO_45 [Mycobacterium phage SororFago]
MFMNLQWHGEADMVETDKFEPVTFTLSLDWDKEHVEIVTTTTPDVQYDPLYMRQTVHKLLDQLVDQLLEKGVM